MQPAQPNTRIRRRETWQRVWCGALLASTVAVAGCDSAVGIAEDANRPSRFDHATTTPAAALPTAPAATAPVATPTGTTTVPPADAPPVGAVPGRPLAAAAVQSWAADLRTATTAELQTKCWTLAPRNVADMYEDKQAILTALAQPGVASADALTWKSHATTVVVDPAAVESGYACPRVYPAGTEIAFNEADARHTVRRYLSRFVGTPLDPTDKEGAYPLVCKASTDWDPTGSGRAVTPPLAGNPGKLTGVTKFTDQELSSQRLHADYVSVQVPVTNAAGVVATRTFTLAETAEGYCVGDVSP
ncbi:hypothetical protein D5S18_12950 [Nocardia panacis]|uniref:Sensor domain-containing protein n=1 Tax=Nocardia panacis TaxID=2340916 RepID=A0A3A4K7E7_9NOCA|nr:hypothetical protein [Nocardia panacis]RJO77079.1 hypothetical protein D5S18_12950 [Nocardia panacis]